MMEMDKPADRAYKLVPGNGAVFEEGGQRFYWNCADNGTVIERDFQRLKEEYGDRLVEMREFAGVVMQKWRA